MAKRKHSKLPTLDPLSSLDALAADTAAPDELPELGLARQVDALLAELTPRELAVLEERFAAALPPRPVTRADCVDGPRPCPYVSCRHHLAITVLRSGALRIEFAGVEDGEFGGMVATCSLDVADQVEPGREGVLSDAAIGRLMGKSGERVRQIGERALLRVARAIRDEEPKR